MNNQIIKLSIIILSAIFLLSSPVLAGGKGKGKNKTQPPGWEQGQKTGWKGEETPPGLNEEKLQKKQKAGMEGEETKARVQEQSKKTKREAEREKEKEQMQSKSKKKNG